MTGAYYSLLRKIKTKEAKIGVIGLGYVGLPLAVLLAKKGFSVTGFVRSREKKEMLVSGKSYIEDEDVTINLPSLIKKKKLNIEVTNTKYLQMMDILIICVPTPVTDAKKPDLTDLRKVGEQLMRLNLIGKLIINESTVAPYTTREILGNFKSKYFLVCSPERVDPGNKKRTTEFIQKVIGGKDRNSASLARELYKQILKESIVEVKSLEGAEMVKMLENTYRAVNIALINEFAKLAELCDIDILDVIKAAKTKWSFQAHYPTIGVGGHCIPVDPYYILELAQQKNLTMNVVRNGLLENEEMPQYVFKKLQKIYKRGMNILVYGITYKKNVKDLRESPVLVFCGLLEKKNIKFSVYDPYIDSDEIKKMGYTPGAANGNVDILVIGTGHNNLKKDSLMLVGKNTIVVDGQNYFKNKLGKSLYGIGRQFT